MTTPEFQQFQKNIHYAHGLITGGKALEGLKSLSATNFGDLSVAEPADLYRAAWSQAVAALDHWMHQEIINRAVALTNDVGKERPPALQRLEMPFATVERMNTEPVYKVFREFLEEELGRTSYQKSQRLTEGLRLVTHDSPSQIWNKIGGLLGMPAGDVKARQDAVVHRRNRIAHSADLDPGGVRTPMSEAEARSTVDWIHALVIAIQQFLG